MKPMFIKRLKPLLFGFTFFCLTLFGIRELYFWVIPSVTIVNNADRIITSATLKLPNSTLSFDAIQAFAAVEIHHDLPLKDGTIHYLIMLNANEPLKGNCGYLTPSMYGEHWTITVATQPASRPTFSVICTHNSDYRN